MRERILSAINKDKLVVILRNIPDDKIVPTVQALRSGGVHCIEVTFVQTSREDILHTAKQQALLKEHFGDSLLLGAGTVVTPEQVLLAKKAGCEFIISPNTDREVIECTRNEELVSLPGAYTPSEVCEAWKYGADYVKIFPVPEADGPAYIKQLKGPLPHIPLLAVGGVDKSLVGDFLKAGAAGFGVGTKIAGAAKISSFTSPEDFDEIRRNAEGFLSEIRKSL